MALTRFLCSVDFWDRGQLKINWSPLSTFSKLKFNKYEMNELASIYDDLKHEFL